MLLSLPILTLDSDVWALLFVPSFHCKHGEKKPAIPSTPSWAALEFSEFSSLLKLILPWGLREQTQERQDLCHKITRISISTTHNSIFILIQSLTITVSKTFQILSNISSEDSELHGPG